MDVPAQAPCPQWPPAREPGPGHRLWAWFAWRGVRGAKSAGLGSGAQGVGLPLPGGSPVSGAGWPVGGWVLPAMALPGVVREGRQVFWVLNFARRCAIKLSGVMTVTLDQPRKGA